jgi:hypothetical protein
MKPRGLWAALAVVAIATGIGIAPWAQRRLLSPVVLLDTAGGVSQDYRVRAIPTVYVIGRDMRRASGTRAWDEGPKKALLDYLVKAPAG